MDLEVILANRMVVRHPRYNNAALCENCMREALNTTLNSPAC